MYLTTRLDCRQIKAEHGNSPKRYLLWWGVDNMESQRGVAGGALERVDGAGGQLAPTASSLGTMRACGF